MKKILFFFLGLLVTCSVFSQKSIDNPDYGMSTIPGSLTKIELTPEATILHFYIKSQPGSSISVPKESYIQDVNGGEKIFMTKTEGIPLGKRYTIPESGEVNYQLYFPKLSSAVNKVDFGEANAGGNWSIYDIVIKEQEASLLPKELRGNWFLADGSNQWDFGFYTSNAVVDKVLWNYKMVEKKKNNYTIVLERNGKQKTFFAQIDKKGGTSFGFDKQKMQSYSTTKIENPNYKVANDEPYADMIFKLDSATYSGIIKGYTARAGKKTGTVAVNDVFTGNQNSYLVKIADDGSFSIKFPINHPQTIFVRLPSANAGVFVEPGKETFHLVDQNAPLFMGDCARMNTDLVALLNIGSYEDYLKMKKNILETNPQDYKGACLLIKEKQLQALNEFAKKQLIGQKAFQIKKLEIEYGALGEMLSYDMYRNTKKTGTTAESKTSQDYKLEVSYYDFITEPFLNDKLAVLTYEYSSFINRLRFADILRKSANGLSYTSLSETAQLLQQLGVNLTKDEQDIITASKKLEKSYARIMDFYKKNYEEYQKFYQNHKEALTKLQKENPDTDGSIVSVADYLSKNGVAFSSTEKELIADFKIADYTKDEQVLQKQFGDKYGESLKGFNEKYKINIQEIADESDFQKLNQKLNEMFGIKEAFVFDVMTLQQNSKNLERDKIPYIDNQLKWIQGKIKDPFLSNYIVVENNRIKAQIEANKVKSDYTINTVKKTEGDELFESMITKFKGKVIYVDFWATWCGPCMQGIKNIAPLKEDMKNQDVVFLYITNQTSPENTWNRSIPDIKGEHYRVSQDEWNYLSQKFKISGIPHYALVNKKNEIVNPKLGHNSNEALKRILEEQMK
nr:TlpA disulfide reductase family protein [uncultured Flavobacterium sp.]